MTSEPLENHGLVLPGKTAVSRQQQLQRGANAPSVYRSIIAGKVILRLITTPLLSLGAGAALLYLEFLIGWALIIIALLVATVLPVLRFPCRYTITPDRLVIRHGINVETIPMARIRGAFPAEDASKSSTLKERRVRLNLTKGHRIIAPERRLEFIRELRQRAFLSRDGDR